MRKLILMFLVGGFSLAMTACGGGSATSEEADTTTMEEPAMPAEQPMMEEAPADTTMMQGDSTAM